jgi:hypothetical protein
MTTEERLALLKKARAATAATIDEIKRRLNVEPLFDVRRTLSPILIRARNQLTDLDLMINDLEGATAPIALDPAQLTELDRLSAQLDKAIVRDALIGLAVDSVTSVLQSVQDVRDTLA